MVELGFAVFVAHGREREAADFYSAAYGAELVKMESHGGAAVSFDMRLGTTAFTVAGSNPRREQSPFPGGPFVPKAAGAVNVVFCLEVDDIGEAFGRALAAGATVRHDMDVDEVGQAMAVVLDPFGYIWGLVQR